MKDKLLGKILSLTVESSLNSYDTKEMNINFLKFIEYNNIKQCTKVIHIAGTNGKGSTTHMLSTALNSTLNVGVFCSPHIFKLNERIKINNKLIDDKFILEFIDRNIEFLSEHTISTFEFFTVLAFSYFEEMQVDLILLETGLGGDLDTTNYFHTDFSVITNVDKDHVHILGNTLEEIAYQKFGIIREGNPAIFGDSRISLQELFKKYVVEHNAKLVDRQYILNEVEIDNKYIYFKFMNNDYKCDLNARYQAKNIELVCNILIYLNNVWGLNFDLKRLENVEENSNFFGRFTTIDNMIFDVAHNVSGIQNFFENITISNPNIIFGAMKTKEYEKMTRLVLQKSTNVVFCEFNNPLSMKDIDFKKIDPNIKVFKNINVAIESFGTEKVYIFGSNYLISEFNLSN